MSNDGTTTSITPLKACDPRGASVLSEVHEQTIERCAHHIFEERAALHPDAVAVVYEGEQLTYGELDELSNRVAHCLMARYGAGPDRRIGLCVERSVAMLVGLLGIWKAGAAYVPMEPSYPGARIAHMVADSGAEVVLTRHDDQRSLEASPAPHLLLDRPQDMEGYPRTRPQAMVQGNHLAYVIYTSGSTGQPKGVMVEHRSIVNFWQVMAQTTHAGCAPGARVALNASIAFDMSLKGVLQLLSGHSLYLIPQAIRADGVKLLSFLRTHRIEIFDSTPSQMAVLLAAGLLEPTAWQASAVLLGGEPINAAMWHSLRSSSTTRFFNMYGPTECTVDATIGSIEAHDALAHIGRPIANARIYLLDDEGQPVSMGATGEIHIGGAGVARGYLHQPELTARHFLRDPFWTDAVDARMYRTGDFGRWLDDGRLVYLGRKDFQVKLRGFRVELGEIERRLMESQHVRQAAVLALGEGSAKYLVAFLVLEAGAPDQCELIAELKQCLGAELPHYMLPQAYLMLPVLPLTANGKLDRDALSRRAAERPADDYVAPRTETERVLADIWCELMDHQDISVRSDFFELGGQSLLAICVVNGVAARLGVQLDVHAIFEHSTIEALAAHIDGKR